ncbi:MAG: uracil phosphoribosyltransferase [Methanobacterium sp.]|nr:uracil phosphoribosyltransferase [Methanobacterium sp.]
MEINLLDHLPIQDRVTRLRRSGIKGSDFRTFMIEIGMFMSYEFAKTLEKEVISVKTPLAVTEGEIIKDEPSIIVVNVLRAAVPLVEGIIRIFNEAECGLIGAWREETPPFKVNMNYTKIPDINGKIVLIADPMLATGHTLKEILNKIKSMGNPKRMVLFNVISSREGIDKLQKSHPEIEIYTCAIDNEVNDDGYIVPGLGDAGDISFGKPI